jgi:adenosylhomocysteine nucleosidase
VGPVAFVCAMPMELRPLSRQLRLRKDDVGGLPVRVGTIGEQPVVAVVTGMGTALAATGTERLLDAISPARVVVVGITGALEDETAIGTLVWPELVVLGATGREHRPEHLGPGPPRGTMWTTDRITPREELPALLARGVVSLDMETAAVAERCEGRGVPWSVVRAISDRASDGSVDDEVFGLSHQDGTPDPRAIARYVVRHPGRLPRMVGLAKGAKLATERAATAAIDAVRSLS